uniref:protein-tyrosine-phosphatase n=1 Tax=Laticauda laticaudata TaxID=8630 RepID=A0A8C5RB00_LATLA
WHLTLNLPFHFLLLKTQFFSFVAGGLSSFKQNHENLCDNSLQLQECPESEGGGAAVTCTLPQSIATTPDIENAELTPILPFLFLGNEHDAQDLEKIQRLNIGYVINVTTHLPLYHYEKGLFSYKRLPATDSNKQNLRQYFEEAFEFIEEAHQCGKGLLIHCQAGVSRSATIVIAYLMKHTRMTMTDAYKFVKGKRPIISPNLNFMGQLLEFEEDLNNGESIFILSVQTNYCRLPSNQILFFKEIAQRLLA